MLLRSRIVLPVTRPPIEDGALRIRDESIESVGPWKDLKSQPGEAVVDLGDAILLPGLINAHCHLDYTDMAGLISPQKHFADWIKAIVALKATWGYSEFAQSWIHGARMLLNSGTTTVADVEAVPELLPEAWQLGPLRLISFCELISLKWDAAAQKQFAAQIKTWERLPHPTGCTGLSPHAPYTTTPELLREAAKVARQKNWLLTTHLSESEEELKMFRDRRGSLFEWLAPQRDTSDCGQGTSVQHAARCGYLGENLLAVHANYLDAADIRSLATSGASIVHCPRSHAYFGHRRFPFTDLQRAGVNICLGTDSLASVRKARNQQVRLSMLEEMRTFAKWHPDVDPATILQLATVNGARALKQSGLGELVSGAKADVIAVPHTGSVREAMETIVHFQGDVAGSMINGQWAVEPPQ
jgi:cytosine/adenosine deaminase-related metal-dependent hydrolase